MPRRRNDERYAVTPGAPGVLPSLGRLATVFERTRAKGAADEAKLEGPAKPEGPAGDPKPDA